MPADPTTPPALPPEIEAARCQHCGGDPRHSFCPRRFCSLCGNYYDYRSNHADCRPFSAEVQEVLKHMEAAGLCWQADTIRAHIAALTSERDEARAEAIELGRIAASLDRLLDATDPEGLHRAWMREVREFGERIAELERLLPEWPGATAEGRRMLKDQYLDNLASIRVKAESEQRCRQVKIEALEWALGVDTSEYSMKVHLVRELTRLRAEQEKPSDA